MAQFIPLRFATPSTNEAAQAVASVPYDVVSTEEARALARGNPRSFLHVTRPEIDLVGESPSPRELHQLGRRYFERMLNEGTLKLSETPTAFLYRLEWRGQAQIGFVGGFSVDEYDCGAIVKHEKTRQDKEDERTIHTLAFRGNSEPVFLIVPESPNTAGALRAMQTQLMTGPELYRVEFDDGVKHQLWEIDSASTRHLAKLFADVPKLYIADGHHRSAAASRARKMMNDGKGVAIGGAQGSTDSIDYFLAVAFLQNDLRILPYNRLIRDLNGHTLITFLERLRQSFSFQKLGGNAHLVLGSPMTSHEFRMYLEGNWYLLRSLAKPEAGSREVLDVDLLQEQLLGPILGIENPRVDRRIRFVGGIYGPEVLASEVDAGRAAVAFSLFPTSVAQVIDTSDRGEVMPPKSTWFEPKLRSGLFAHVFEATSP